MILEVYKGKLVIRLYVDDDFQVVLKPGRLVEPPSAQPSAPQRAAAPAPASFEASAVPAPTERRQTAEERAPRQQGDRQGGMPAATAETGLDLVLEEPEVPEPGPVEAEPAPAPADEKARPKEDGGEKIDELLRELLES